MTDLFYAYLFGIALGAILGALLMAALWDRATTRTGTRPAADQLATDVLPRIHHLDDARRRKETTR